MAYNLNELLGAVALGGLAYCLWVLWGRAAQRLGVSRLVLLGGLLLLGKLLG